MRGTLGETVSTRRPSTSLVAACPFYYMYYNTGLPWDMLDNSPCSLIPAGAYSLLSLLSRLRRRVPLFSLSSQSLSYPPARPRPPCHGLL